MPIDDRSRRHEDKRSFPSRPDSSQGNPEQFVYRRQAATRSFGVKHQQLLTESQVFKDEILAGAENANDPADQVPEGGDHGRKSYRIAAQRVVSKSFILRMQEVLSRARVSVCGACVSGWLVADAELGSQEQVS